MPQQELLKKVVDALETFGIEYMVTGSFASSMQGEPRMTHDIDVVVAMKRENAEELARSFPAPDYFLDKDSILKAIQDQKMFNLIDVRGGDKVDFWLLTDEPFDYSRFSRRRAEDFLGTTVKITSPEDTILAKLRWAKLCGGSEKQFTDALRVYEVQREKLEMDYMQDWVKKLGVGDLFTRLVEEAEEI